MPAFLAALPLLTKIGLAAGAAKTGAGLAQTFTSGQKKAERALDKSIEAIPDYTQAPSILKIYEETARRRGISPEQTIGYRRTQQQLKRNLAQGIAGLQDRRGGLLGIQGLTRGIQDATLGAEAAAEGDINRRFGQYMQASQMKAGQEAAAEQRKLLKQQQRISAAQAKAVGRAAVKRAGLTNIFSGLTDIGKAAMSEEGK